jgi:hypothetical protein
MFREGSEADNVNRGVEGFPASAPRFIRDLAILRQAAVHVCCSGEGAQE